jgi:hypothetical protein
VVLPKGFVAIGGKPCSGSLYALTAESDLYDRIVTTQRNDEDIQIIK